MSPGMGGTSFRGKKVRGNVWPERMHLQWFGWEWTPCLLCMIFVRITSIDASRFPNPNMSAYETRMAPPPQRAIFFGSCNQPEPLEKDATAFGPGPLFAGRFLQPIEHK